MKVIILIFTLLSFNYIFAQQHSVKTCLSFEYSKQLFEKSPKWESANNKIYERDNYAKSSDIKIIPVVFHIIYNTPEQNLHDSVISNQLEILNRDFAHNNADTSFLRSIFNGIVGDANIRFVMADTDPNGNITNGITRTSTNLTTFGSLDAWYGNFTLVNKIASTLDGGEDAWDITKYYNIWVANTIFEYSNSNVPAFYGLATPPPGLPNWPADHSSVSYDGAFIHFEALGSNNPNTAVYPDWSGDYYQWNIQGRTLVHETGHYLGLRHIYGDSDNCYEGDGVEDTPNATASNGSTCNVGQNTCTDTHPEYGDLPDMIENYMDYSDESCQVSFTIGQITLMRGVLENERVSLPQSISSSINSIVKNSIEIYPNPTKNALQILSIESNIESISIIDITGRTIINKKYNSNINRIKLNISSLPNGIYLLKISTADKTISKKIIKEWSRKSLIINA